MLAKTKREMPAKPIFEMPASFERRDIQQLRQRLGRNGDTLFGIFEFRHGRRKRPVND